MRDFDRFEVLSGSETGRNRPLAPVLVLSNTGPDSEKRFSSEIRPGSRIGQKERKPDGANRAAGSPTRRPSRSASPLTKNVAKPAFVIRIKLPAASLLDLELPLHARRRQRPALASCSL